MIVEQIVEITMRVVLEIDTDTVEYGVHGGCEEPEEIAAEAVRYYAENSEINPGLYLPKGMRELRQNVQCYH